MFNFKILLFCVVLCAVLETHFSAAYYDDDEYDYDSYEDYDLENKREATLSLMKRGYGGYRRSVPNIQNPDIKLTKRGYGGYRRSVPNIQNGEVKLTKRYGYGPYRRSVPNKQIIAGGKSTQ